MSKAFARRVEDFECEHCGSAVSGDGYTNHCPVCLWSKHVDVHPGDRAAHCGGMMEPAQVVSKGSSFRILHRCALCGHEKLNDMTPDDSIETALAIASHH
ncbi:MAG: RNHCP domain-containing protein [Patescibacteria group bacterium]